MITMAGRQTRSSVFVKVWTETMRARLFRDLIHFEFTMHILIETSNVAKELDPAEAYPSRIVFYT